MRKGIALLALAVAILTSGIAGGWYYSAVVYPTAQARECPTQDGRVTCASLAPVANQPLYLLAEVTTIAGIVLLALGGAWLGRDGGLRQRGVVDAATPEKR